MEISKRPRKLLIKVRVTFLAHHRLFSHFIDPTLCFIVLQEKPDDKEAFHCKVVSLIHQSCFREAVDVINSAPKKGYVRV